MSKELTEREVNMLEALRVADGALASQNYPANSCSRVLLRQAIASYAPKPRRWVVEFPPDCDHFMAGATINSVNALLVREVKPITRDDIANAVRKNENRYTGGSYNHFLIRLVLQELGFEVEQ